MLLLINIFFALLSFFYLFLQDCSLPQILHLWLDYNFYLPNSETPPFSRQTVVVEQIKAPSIFKIYFVKEKIFIINFRDFNFSVKDNLFELFYFIWIENNFMRLKQLLLKASFVFCCKIKIQERECRGMAFDTSALKKDYKVCK